MLLRGTVLATGAGGDIGKLVKLTAGTEAASYGVLLDEVVDTGAAYSDGSVTARSESGSVSRCGSDRPDGVDAGLIAVALEAEASSSRARSRFRRLLLCSRAKSRTEQEREPYVASAESLARRGAKRTKHVAVVRKESKAARIVVVTLL